ncbi:unnamed protein product [Agarophyton chilense]
MVIIALKTTFVNLIISVLSCLSELLAVSALLALRTRREWSFLSKGNQISVPHSKRRRLQLQACALIFFVILEIFLVFSIRPCIATRSVRCVAVDTSIRFDQGGPSQQAESAALKCLILNRGRFTQYNATKSASGRIRCGTKHLFHFRLRSTTLFTDPLQDQQPTVDPKDLTISCSSKSPNSDEDNTCLLVLESNKTIYMSDLLFPSPPSQLPDAQTFPFSATSISYDVSPKQIEFLGVRGANTLLDGIREPVQFRHRVFSGFSNETCEERDTNPLHTQVHPAMLAGLILVWVTPVLFYVVLCFAKPLATSFFDMRDPMHWAERTCRTSKPALEKNVVVKLVEMNGEERVLVCAADEISAT